MTCVLREPETGHRAAAGHGPTGHDHLGADHARPDHGRGVPAAVCPRSQSAVHL